MPGLVPGIHVLTDRRAIMTSMRDNARPRYQLLRFRAATRATPIKCSAREAFMLRPASIRKPVTDESLPRRRSGISKVILPAPLTLDEISGGRRRLALPSGAGVRGRDRTIRSCAMYVRVVSGTRRVRLAPRRARHSQPRAGCRITALTKHSPARSATVSASRPRRSSRRRALIVSSFRSPSS